VLFLAYYGVQFLAFSELPNLSYFIVPLLAYFVEHYLAYSALQLLAFPACSSKKPHYTGNGQPDPQELFLPATHSVHPPFP
jgi:hypothetical protein